MQYTYKPTGQNFNSQPHEEADTSAEGTATGDTNFNSQPHEEADELKERFCEENCGISTHSLTKRLTAYQCRLVSLPENFNSQPHEEADSNSVQKFLVQNCIFVTIAYISFSVHLLFNFLRIFSS